MDIKEENVAQEGVTENVEHPTEEGKIQNPAQNQEQPKGNDEKKYTEAEMRAEVSRILSERAPRRDASIRRNLEREYAPALELAEVMRAGTGQQDLKQITEQLRGYYGKSGVQMPQQAAEASYSDDDLAVLANADAKGIIDAGLDEVVEETERLAKLGVEKMTPREKQMFKVLATYRQNAERNRELAKLGVSESEYNSEAFKKFAAQFVSDVPITQVYKMYAGQSQPEKAEPAGSMSGHGDDQEKTYYTPEEVDKLTPKDYNNPAVMRNVRASMLKWPKK